MPRAALNRSTVIARAAEIADRVGFDDVSLAVVARSFDVRTPSLYGHVRDLAALRDGVTALAMDELSDEIADAIAGRAAQDALRGFATAHRTYLKRHPGRWESLQRRAGRDAVEAPSASRIVRVTHAVLHGYGIAESDRVHVTRILGGALGGFLNLERIGSFDHSSPAVDESWEELLASLHFLLSEWDRRSAERKGSS